MDSVGRLAGAADRAPDVDLRPGGVTVRLAVDSPDGLPAGNLELARWISAAARELGVDVWVAEVDVAG